MKTVDTKLVELRDSATFIPAIAILMESEHPKEHYLLRRAGYGGTRCVLLTGLDGGRKAEYDCYAWNTEPFRSAHNYLTDHWDDVKTGDVLDGEFLRGETDQPKKSESEPEKDEPVIYQRGELPPGDARGEHDKSL